MLLEIAVVGGIDLFSKREELGKIRDGPLGVYVLATLVRNKISAFFLFVYLQNLGLPDILTKYYQHCILKYKQSELDFCPTRR